MQARIQYEPTGCGPGNISLSIYYENGAVRRLRHSEGCCCYNCCSDSTTLRLPVYLPGSMNQLYATWDAEMASCDRKYCTASSNVVKIIESSGLRFEKSFFSATVCWGTKSASRCQCCCLMPTCGCYSPLQVFYKITTIIHAQIAVSEDTYNRFANDIKAANPTNVDWANDMLISLRQRAVEKLETMTAFFEEKAKANRVGLDEKYILKESTQSEMEEAKKAALTRAAINQTVFAKFEKSLSLKLQAKVERGALTKEESDDVKKSVISYFMQRNKSMIAFLRERKAAFNVPTSVPQPVSPVVPESKEAAPKSPQMNR